MYQDDLTLAAKIAIGDEAAARRLVGEHHQGLQRFFVALGNSPDDAADLAQTTFIRVQLKVGSYRGEAPLKTWLYRVALREHSTRARRRRLNAPLDALLGKAITTPALDSAGIAVWQAIGRLSLPIRSAFVLHEIVGFSTIEISEMLDTPVGTITSRLSIARKRLRKLLDDKTEELPHEKPQFEST